METDILPTYETIHLPLATFLYTKNVQLLEIKMNKKRGCFIFTQVPRQFVIDYNNGTALVEPNSFAGYMTELIQKVRTIQGVDYE